MLPTLIHWVVECRFYAHASSTLCTRDAEAEHESREEMYLFNYL